MILRHFYIGVVVRVILLLGNVLLIASIFGNAELLFNQLILIGALVFQIIELIRYVNHTNREVARFVYALRHEDFSVSFQKGLTGKSFIEMHRSFSDLLDAYKRVKIEKEVQFQFLQKLVDQLTVGIIALEEEQIVLINPAAQAISKAQGSRDWRLIQQRNPLLANTIDAIGNFGRRLLEVVDAGETKTFAIDVSTLTILEKRNRLVTLQDINSEIEQKEIEAWHKLIRILTHEIMNSLTPVTSLTETMQGILTTKGNPKSVSELTDESIRDIRFSLDTIHKRSEGLLHFVESYRQLTRVPKPAPQLVRIGDLYNHIANLFSVQAKLEGIELTIKVEPEDLAFSLDRNLIEQAMINLVSNSTYALTSAERKSIMLAAYRKDRAVVLEVTDTGKGITEKEMKEIFIPFFTTRKNGSGIGLSLTKQIVSLHGGRITVTSTPSYGTSFFLRFKDQSDTGIQKPQNVIT